MHSEYDIVIIGSGIAGLSCIIQLIQNKTTRQIHLFEKHSKLGGNSILATSGLSIFNPDTGDTEESYLRDIKESNTITSRICKESANILTFLKSIGIRLPSIVKTGMHSIARTYTNTSIKSNIGAYIIKRMVQFIKKYTNVHIHTSEPIIGIERITRSIYLVLSKQNSYISNRVVFATGGYGYNKAMLTSRYRNIPTSNKCDITGDGLKLLTENGAVFENRHSVQVHPTGFITSYYLSNKPIPNKIWLCPEILRSMGAILTNLKGKRFVDELESRDTITKAIFKQGGIAVILFPKIIHKLYIAKVYIKEGHIIKYPKNKNYPYMAYITPCIHYTMGGIKVNSKFMVQDKHNKSIPGLFSIGELAHVFNKHRACGLGLVTGLASGMIVGNHI